MPVGRKLQTPAFSGPRTKTQLPPQDRYALAALRDEWGGDHPCQLVLRTVVRAGLAALGWPQDRRVEEYAEYKAQCESTGASNQFEGR